jgi:preprotein translocase subunit SecE
VAEGKKKKTANVRTRVVSSDEASSSKIKKNKKKPTTAKSASASKAETSKSDTKQTLRDKIKARQDRKKSVKPQKELGYFKGAWHELRQVRWPNRKTTWGLTLAVILFTAFFVVLVLLLDAGFKYLFDLIIK